MRSSSVVVKYDGKDSADDDDDDDDKIMGCSSVLISVRARGGRERRARGGSTDI